MTLVTMMPTNEVVDAADGNSTRKREREQEKQEQQEQGVVVATAADTAANQTLACCQCQTETVKYRCPRCERITCSLACCLAHKKEFECDGKRDRTQYIATKKFTDANLSSDYFFLEEISRSTNSATRSRNALGVNVRRYGAARPPSKKRRGATATVTPNTANGPTAGGNVNPHVPSDWLTRFPVAFQLLVQHATKRGVTLTLLAPGMSKRVRNTSYMDTKQNKLYWRVEWVFPSAEVPVSLAENRACDSSTLFELLAPYLDKRLENTGLRGKLKQYARPDWRQHINILLRKEFTPASQPQYYRLDGNLSLESNLKRKDVVEYPVLTIVLEESLPEYPPASDLIEIVTPAPTGGVPNSMANGAIDDEDDDDGDDDDESQAGEEGAEVEELTDADIAGRDVSAEVVMVATQRAADGERDEPMTE